MPCSNSEKHKITLLTNNTIIFNKINAQQPKDNTLNLLMVHYRLNEGDILSALKLGIKSFIRFVLLQTWPDQHRTRLQNLKNSHHNNCHGGAFITMKNSIIFPFFLIA